jgi:hypothetical protein
MQQSSHTHLTTPKQRHTSVCLYAPTLDRATYACANSNLYSIVASKLESTLQSINQSITDAAAIQYYLLHISPHLDGTIIRGREQQTIPDGEGHDAALVSEQRPSALQSGDVPHADGAVPHPRKQTAA